MKDIHVLPTAYDNFWNWLERRSDTKILPEDRLFFTGLAGYIFGWLVSTGILYHVVDHRAPVFIKVFLAGFISIFWPLALPVLLSVKFFGLFF